VLSDAAESDASEDNDKVESTSTEGDSE